jgi:hypothetical protein
MPELADADQSVRYKHIVLAIARWLILILIGWLIYALVRALWAFVHLGAPLFDWQWYLVLVAFGLSLAVRMIWRLPRSALTMTILVGLVIWAVIGYFGFWQKIHLYPAHADPIPISYWGGRTLVDTPEKVLEDVKSTGGRLYITVGGNSFDGEKGQNLLEGLRRLAERNVDVYLCITTSDYLSVPVTEKWIASVQKVAAVVRDENLTNVRGIIGDAEHPKHMPLDVLGLDRDNLFQAVENLDDLIHMMGNEHADLALGVTALWTLYLDSLDGDADVSIIHRSSVDPPGNWDFINVMTYSSYLPPSWRAYYVYIVEQTMSRLYPDLQPSYLIGLTAAGRPGEPTLEFDDLVRDAQISRAMGVPEIVVFKLNEQMVEDWGDNFVRRLAIAVNEAQPDLSIAIPFSRPASILVYGTLFADAVMDVRSWRGVFLLGWMILSGLIVYYTDRKAR